ncbi:hypothetical protein PQX77_001552, partial [Marasmius sp. AFHP31]
RFFDSWDSSPNAFDTAHTRRFQWELALKCVAYINNKQLDYFFVPDSPSQIHSNAGTVSDEIPLPTNGGEIDGRPIRESDLGEAV